MVLIAARTLRVALAAAALALGLASAPARAEDATREGAYDMFLVGQFAVGDDTSAANGLIDLEYQDTFAGGIGFGHNFNDHVNVNATLLVGPAELEASVFGLSTDDDATLIAPDLNVDWNLFDAKVTPFLTAGVGLMIFTGAENDEIDFSYGAGAGVRWDFGDSGFMKVWYRAKWFEFEDADDTLLTHTFNFAIGIIR